MLNFNDLRDQVKEWSDKNFGSTEQQGRPYRPYIGMVEEHGELVEACEKLTTHGTTAYEAIRDAVADMLIFGADYASRKGWNYEQILTAANPQLTQPIQKSLLQISKHLGTMAHAHLKTEQGIRGDADKHNQAAIEAFGFLCGELRLICSYFGWDIRQVTNEVWQRVRQRDFTKNAVNGEVSS